MTLDQDVTRFRTVRRATALMRWMKVRRWQPPRIGADSLGMYEAFLQYGGADWSRTVVARTGRTVTVQEVTPYVGKVDDWDDHGELLRTAYPDWRFASEFR